MPKSLKEYKNRLIKSIWLFPVVLALPLLALTGLKISGSSLGSYHDLFYGDVRDSNLLLNKPRPIRSDEWLVNTQMVIGQKNNDFKTINENIGNGQDMSILNDVPYKHWSILFKLHNIPFLVAPFDYAFAFRWWFIGYLLITSLYFFVLELMPNKRLFASIISLSLFFSPFVQWWYLYSTIGSIYHSLFIAIAVMKLFKSKRVGQSLFWSALLAYSTVSFVLVLYPPFQIACSVAIGGFLLGFFANRLKLDPRDFLKKLALVMLSITLAAGICGLFFISKKSTVRIIENTAYPGQRVISGGGYDLVHVVSSHLSTQFQYTGRAAKYRVSTGGAENQSEASNFITIAPFLIIPAVYLLLRQRKKRLPLDWPLLATAGAYTLLMVRLATPALDGVFRLALLDKVPQNRLVIGVGLLGLLLVIAIVRNLSERKSSAVSKHTAYAYTLLVLISQVFISLYVFNRSPGFIGVPKAIILSFFIPAIVLLLLRRRFVFGASLLLVLSIISSVGVNPLYRGTAIVTDTELSKAITENAKQDSGRWIAEGIMIENFAILSGVRSLSGTYAYPQLELWDDIDNRASEATYNRYAHVNFTIDRDPNIINDTSVVLAGGDNFRVNTEACSVFLESQSVSFVLTDADLTGDPCLILADRIEYPLVTYYIYRITRQ